MSKISYGWAGPNLEARIAAHVHAWQRLKESKQPRPPEVHPFITIAREFGCEGAALAHRLIEILNERCRPSIPWVAYDHELLDKVSQELHLHNELISALDGRRRDEMSELFEAILNRRVDDALVVRKLAEVVRSLAVHGHSVLVGRGSYLITQDLKTGMHVRLVAPFEWRAHQVASVRGIDYAEAKNLVTEGERERAHYVHTYFVQDPAHVVHHDLVIDNSRFNLAQIAEIVFTAVGARFGETLVSA